MRLAEELALNMFHMKEKDDHSTEVAMILEKDHKDGPGGRNPVLFANIWVYGPQQ